MKKMFLLLSFFFFNVNYAQVVNDTKESLHIIDKSSADSDVTISVPNPNEPVVEGDNKIYIVTDVMAEPKQGIAKFREDFAKSIKKPKDLNDFNTLRVMLSFVVEKDGKLVDIRVLRDPGYGIGEQCIRALKRVPNWKPATKNGVTVRSQFTLPVTFQF